MIICVLMHLDIATALPFGVFLSVDSSHSQQNNILWLFPLVFYIAIIDLDAFELYYVPVLMPDIQYQAPIFIKLKQKSSFARINWMCWPIKVQNCAWNVLNILPIMIIKCIYTLFNAYWCMGVGVVQQQRMELKICGLSWVILSYPGFKSSLLMVYVTCFLDRYLRHAPILITLQLPQG